MVGLFRFYLLLFGIFQLALILVDKTLLSILVWLYSREYGCLSYNYYNYYNWNITHRHPSKHIQLLIPSSNIQKQVNGQDKYIHIYDE